MRPSKRIAPTVERLARPFLEWRAATSRSFGCKCFGLYRKTSSSQRLGVLVARQQCVETIGDRMRHRPPSRLRASSQVCDGGYLTEAGNDRAHSLRFFLVGCANLVAPTFSCARLQGFANVFVIHQRIEGHAGQQRHGAAVLLAAKFVYVIGH